MHNVVYYRVLPRIIVTSIIGSIIVNRGDGRIWRVDRPQDKCEKLSNKSLRLLRANAVILCTLYLPMCFRLGTCYIIKVNDEKPKQLFFPLVVSRLA